MKENLSDRQAIFLAFIFVFFVGGTMLIYYFQEKKADEQINTCLKVTVAYPVKFVPRSKIYYYFYLNGKKINDSYTIPYPTMGKFERGTNLMNERFWVRVNCENYNINRIFWDSKVPDTLKIIPEMGWDNIPYGLDKK